MTTLRLALAAAAGLSMVAGAVVGPASVPAAAVAQEAPAPVRIMPLGDSITFGLGSVRLGSYRVELQQRLRAAGVAVDFVGSQSAGSQAGVDRDNEGHPGWEIAEVTERVDGWLATYRPDVVLLHIGTNDMRTPAKASGAAVRLSRLIDRMLLASPDVRIMVAKITGANDEKSGRFYSRNIDPYNARIPAIVSSKGPRVRLVDQTGVDGTDLLDRLHPNEYGYKKMAWTWYRALEPLLNRTGRAWPQVNNPFRATAKHIRLHSSRGTDARWWHLRKITVTRHGKRVLTQQWQTRRTTTESYRAKAKGKWVTRTRTATRWSAT